MNVYAFLIAELLQNASFDCISISRANDHFSSVVGCRMMQNDVFPVLTYCRQCNIYGNANMIKQIANMVCFVVFLYKILAIMLFIYNITPTLSLVCIIIGEEQYALSLK